VMGELFEFSPCILAVMQLLSGSSCLSYKGSNGEISWLDLQPMYEAEK
jgi:hypothetical protein